MASRPFVVGGTKTELYVPVVQADGTVVWGAQAQGPAGATGATGATGAQGPPGADGADGADGATGPQGPAGADGATGPQGPAGADGADGADGSSSEAVHQVGHGLAVGDVVRISGASTYAKAQADSAANAEAVGIVSAVSGADDFEIRYSGRVTGLSGLTAGTVYFLSPSAAGALTATEPTTNGQVSKPLLLADSTTSGWFVLFRGELLAAAGGSGIEPWMIEINPIVPPPILTGFGSFSGPLSPYGPRSFTQRSGRRGAPRGRWCPAERAAEF